MMINLKVKPRSSRNEVVKSTDGSFVVYTTKIPADGEANEAVIELLSREFKVAKSRIRIVSGLRSKNKRVRID